MFGKKNANPEMQAAGWVTCLLFGLSTLAALYGVYVTHFGYEGATFGSSNASLSLIAFAVNLGLLIKGVSCMCGHEKK